jgi:hypothetical protein
MTDPTRELTSNPAALHAALDGLTADGGADQPGPGQIYESLGSRVGSTYEEQEVTQYFAAAALVFAVTGAGLAALWFDRFP